MYSLSHLKPRVLHRVSNMVDYNRSLLCCIEPALLMVDDFISEFSCFQVWGLIHEDPD